MYPLLLFAVLGVAYPTAQAPEISLNRGS